MIYLLINGHLVISHLLLARLQGRWPAAVFYRFGHPTQYAYAGSQKISIKLSFKKRWGNDKQRKERYEKWPKLHKKNSFVHCTFQLNEIIIDVLHLVELSVRNLTLCGYFCGLFSSI